MSGAPDWQREGRDWPNRAASRFVDAGPLRFHVQVMGQGPVVLMLHGTGAATHSWRDLMPQLARHFTIVAPDLPGHGFTTGRPARGLTLPAMADAIADLMHAMEVRPELVIGHSAGAAVALKLGIAQGGRAPVIGLNPALTPFPGIAAALFPAFARLLFVNPFAPHVFAGLARVPGEVERVLRRSTGSRIDATGTALYARLFACAGHCAGAIQMMADWDLDALARDLPRVTAPVVLLHGGRDKAVPQDSVERAAARIPGAQIETLADLGHLMHEEAPDVLARRILAHADALGLRVAAQAGEA